MIKTILLADIMPVMREPLSAAIVLIHSPQGFALYSIGSDTCALFHTRKDALDYFNMLALQPVRILCNNGLCAND